MNHKIKLNIGDKLLCKKDNLTIFSLFTELKYYTVDNMILIGPDYYMYSIRCDSNYIINFKTDYQINNYFYNEKEIRKMKLEKLNTL